MLTTTPPTSPNPPQPVAPAPGRSFSELPLSPLLLATLAQLEYRSMTPIQAASLPLALAGHLPAWCARPAAAASRWRGFSK